MLARERTREQCLRGVRRRGRRGGMARERIVVAAELLQRERAVVMQLRMRRQCQRRVVIGERIVEPAERTKRSRAVAARVDIVGIARQRLRVGLGSFRMTLGRAAHCRARPTPRRCRDSARAAGRSASAIRRGRAADPARRNSRTAVARRSAVVRPSSRHASASAGRPSSVNTTPHAATSRASCRARLSRADSCATPARDGRVHAMHARVRCSRPHRSGRAATRARR